ncbi:NUDIX hydrolase [Gracilibacillus sp. S3-1-1]|uniref:NUDIX hydrolase n=1 Tax=Gracilibacillus pellucidus TaxID=3095368 RepID=A0ACC6M9S6_9BACI|nr:NUDIX hydrolase [Gracilibacillus sp. S3-1-1]MDX8047690.1 NUDIX hydrolase [Gracilibacillus sp. S3-1-1]
MLDEKKYHRSFGVYGIYQQDSNLLVIEKSTGPYKNRFDLPGGSLEDGESLIDAMKREFFEETGLEIEVEHNIGIIDFKLPWLWREFTDLHHIAVYYKVRKVGGTLIVPEQFQGQDSLGTRWISANDTTIENSSPLVLKAFEWMETKDLGIAPCVYSEWKIK